MKIKFHSNYVQTFHRKIVMSIDNLVLAQKLTCPHCVHLLGSFVNWTL